MDVKVVEFNTEAQAIAFVRRLNNRLGLPRCDGPQFTTADDGGRGRLAPCPCTAPDEPTTDCPFVTWTFTDVRMMRSKYVVNVPDEYVDRLPGELVDGTPLRDARVDLVVTDPVTQRPRWAGDRVRGPNAPAVNVRPSRER